MIPKIIHQMWRDHNLPVASALPESWRKHNPDWEYRFWTNDETAEFVHAEYPDLWDLFQASALPVQKADIARYLIMHRFGGVYADIDTECFGSLDILADEDRVVLSQEPSEHWKPADLRGMKKIIFSGTIASPAGHSFWPHVIEMLIRCRHAKKSVLDATGPMMLTGCVESFSEPEMIALHSCHLFNPHDKNGVVSQSEEFGPYAPARISTHLWYGTWIPDLKKTDLGKQLKMWLRKRRYMATRGRFLTRDDIEKTLDRDLLCSPLPKPEPKATQNITVLIPVRNASPYLEKCLQLLQALDYPAKHLKLVFCEGDSTDDTYAQLQGLAESYRPVFKDIIVTQLSTGNTTTAKNRWWPTLQRERRSCIAKVRNHLIEKGLAQTDDWALWIDVDVCDYAPDTLQRLLDENEKIVVPNCVKVTGGPSYDLNSFLDIGTPRNAAYYKHTKDGLFQPPKQYYWRSHFDDLRYLDRVPLTCVGGTMLLVHGSIHRAGLGFPEIPYDDLIETEAFGKIAGDFGVTPIGLPNLEIKHVDA